MTRSKIAGIGAAVAAIALAITVFAVRPKPQGTSSTTVDLLPGMPMDVKAALDQRGPVSQEAPSKPLSEAVAATLRRFKAGTALPAEIALDLASKALEADSADCSGLISDVDGDGHPDVIVKRYSNGSGAAFELLVALGGPGEPRCFIFSGGERGVTFYGKSRVPLEAHFLELGERNVKGIVVPQCLVDRGADSVLNWPTVYVYRGGKYIVADREFGSFYQSQVLPKFSADESMNRNRDAEVVRQLVKDLVRR
jgi:hypothetical protein